MDQDVNDAEYRHHYNNVGDRLMLAANRLAEGLLVQDVAGLHFAVGIEFMRQSETDPDIVGYLRDLADAVESGEVGFKHRAH